MNITKQSKLELAVKLRNLYMKLYYTRVSKDFEEGYYDLIFSILDFLLGEIAPEQWNNQLLYFLDTTKSEDWINGYNIALGYARHFEPEYPYDIYAEED